MNAVLEERSAVVPLERVEPSRVALPAPATPAELAGHYDLTISHPEVEATAFKAFDGWLAQEAAELGLSCALLHDRTVREAAARLAAGEMTIGFHLDYFALWHRLHDPYARLAEAIEDAGGRSVNSPARARAFTDKATAHRELDQHGLGVPASIILRPGTPERPLTARERNLLQCQEPGVRLFLKPANGFGGNGVTALPADSGDKLMQALAAARQRDPHDTYLIQREVRTPMLPCDDGSLRPAYWRVLSCFGDLIPFWWKPLDLTARQPCYRRLTPTEIRRHRLQPLLDFVRLLGDICGLRWFSTELCLSEGPETSRFTVPGADGRDRPVVAIDYVNDQCDVDVQSRWPGAPPDDVVRHVACRLAQEAWRLRQERLRPQAVAIHRVAA